MAKRKSRSPRRDGKKPPPKCKALLLCSQCIIEAVTGRISIVGIFDVFAVNDFPGAIGPFTAYVQLVDGIGNYDVTVAVHDLQQDEVIAKTAPTRIVFPERLTRFNLVIPVPPLQLPHSGRYDFVVFADGEEVERQQFIAQSVPEIES